MSSSSDRKTDKDREVKDPKSVAKKLSVLSIDAALDEMKKFVADGDSKSSATIVVQQLKRIELIANLFKMEEIKKDPEQIKAVREEINGICTPLLNKINQWIDPKSPTPKTIQEFKALQKTLSV